MEAIGHLLDSERVYGYRLSLVRYQDNRTILGMGQDLWVSAQRHNEREPSGSCPNAVRYGRY
jgi:hypothetical protein